jgi:uncharacterized membrane protein YqaE (UPF0057 family)
MNLIFGLIAFILAILAIFMPEFGVWTPQRLTALWYFLCLLSYFESLMKALERRLLCLTKTTKPII